MKDKNPFREDNWEIISKKIKYDEIKDTVVKATSMALGSRTKDDFDYENFSESATEPNAGDLLRAIGCRGTGECQFSPIPSINMVAPAAYLLPTNYDDVSVYPHCNVDSLTFIGL